MNEIQFKPINLNIRCKDDSSSTGFTFTFTHPKDNKKKAYAVTCANLNDNVLMKKAWDQIYIKAQKVKQELNQMFSAIPVHINRAKSPQECRKILEERRKGSKSMLGRTYSKSTDNSDIPDHLKEYNPAYARKLLNQEALQTDASNLIERMGDLRRARAFYAHIIKEYGHDMFMSIYQEMGTYYNIVKEDIAEQQKAEAIRVQKASELLLQLQELGLSVDDLTNDSVQKNAKELKRNRAEQKSLETQEKTDQFDKSKPTYKLGTKTWNGEGEIPTEFKTWMIKNNQESLELLVV